MSYAGVRAVESIRGVYALIVDPDAQRRALLSTVLEYCGAYVRESESPERAMRLIGEIRPDVVIADFSPGGHALIEDVRRLKADRGGVVPAIALGAKGLEAAALAGGFTAFVATPFAPWELCRLISTLTTG